MREGPGRQSVQRTADLLAADGLVQYADNPAHRRAKLVRLTPLGQQVLDEITRSQIEWANARADAIPSGEREILQALAVLRQLRTQLERSKRADSEAPERSAGNGRRSKVSNRPPALKNILRKEE